MIRIEGANPGPPWWRTRAKPIPTNAAARCSATIDGDRKTVVESMRLHNAFEGAQAARYELRPEDLAGRRSRRRANASMDLIGIYHSHPDCDAYFSNTDLQNSCPWYSFVVLSIQKGEFHHANSWLPNFDQTGGGKEELSY